MKIATKLATMLLIGSLTTVFASDSTQNTQMTKEDMQNSIELIQAAPAGDRVELVNQFKVTLMEQTVEVRAEAMAMFNTKMGSSHGSDKNKNIQTMKFSSQEMNQNEMMNQNKALNQGMGSMQQNQGSSSQSTSNTIPSNSTSHGSSRG